MVGSGDVPLEERLWLWWESDEEDGESVVEESCVEVECAVPLYMDTFGVDFLVDAGVDPCWDTELGVLPAGTPLD